MKKVISTVNAPLAIGPYSQANQVGNTIYISGQLPIDPVTGEFSSEEIKGQTKQSLENAKAILIEGGFTMENVVKTTVYLDDIKEFVSMNEVYAQYFTSKFPARAAFEVAKLPLGAKVEIEMIAVK
ncbi:RidA family protein [Acidaminobacter sp. JC074]|uniref:RidA family protein n=1 Tax=Acidaminobacter sp. JC074 TaxID=2530199 RepID=UPI001F10C7E9|nr:RidA family protein [Acidaminobacter sp. JC074]MCH4887530.1 RidA family protein [Acidaminobacter sp. JC074]